MIRLLETHFKRSLRELFEDAGISELTTARGSLVAAPREISAPLYDPEHEVSIVWSAGVPDHMWPTIAYRRGYFAEARVRAKLLDAESASDYPHGYDYALQAALPKIACSVIPWDQVV